LPEPLNRRDKEMIEPDSLSLVEALRDSGYRATPHDALTIESSTNGLKFLIHVQEDGSVQFAMAVVNALEYSLKEANDFNSRYRFGKVFLDNQDDIMLTFDLPARYDFKASFFLWDEIVGLFLTELRKTSAAARAGQALSSQAAMQAKADSASH
jgi:Putative bacterial sensory transduction regulator